MIKYGLISVQDGKTIEKCLDLIIERGVNYLLTFEVGVHSGLTSIAIRDYIKSKGKQNRHYAIDNQQDFQMEAPYPQCEFIIGDSVEMSHELSNDVFNFGFIDANHSLHRVIADFVAYAPKIKVGGILAFHDTNPNIKTFKDYQQVGNKEDERMYIQVRKALTLIGLFDNAFPEWELLYDIWDLDNEASGITAFIKIK